MMKRAESKKVSEISKPRKQKMWEVSCRYHCSLVGTCVRISDLRQIIKRCRIHIPGDYSHYDLHSAFVNMADVDSPAMRMLQKMIDRRYEAVIRAFAKAQTPDEIEKLWYEHFDAGKIAGGYWALMSHPLLTKELASRAHGEIHMLSHKASISYQGDMQRLAEQKTQYLELEKQLALSTSGLRETVQERDIALDKLKAQLRLSLELNKQLDTANKRIQALENGETLQKMQHHADALSSENTALRSRASMAELARDNYQNKLVISEGKNQALNTALQKLRYTHKPVRQHIDVRLEKAPAASACKDNTGEMEQLDLCGRCVLVVGGRTGQCEHYRALVEKHNGRFIHHDGGREDSRQRLGSILTQADAVLCPLDSISHDAINRVKRYCEQTTKNLVLMPRSSLSTFAESLRQVAK